MCVTDKDAIVNISKNNALLTKENAGINVALNKAMILKTVAQLGKPIISCLLKPIKTFIQLENIKVLVLIIWSVEANR